MLWFYRYYVCGRVHISTIGSSIVVNRPNDALIHGDVLVCAGPEHPCLYSDWLMVRRSDFNWLLPEFEQLPTTSATDRYEYFVKARYSQKPRLCTIQFIKYTEDKELISIDNIQEYSAVEYSHIKIVFIDGPERAVTVGQIAALYRRPKAIDLDNIHFSSQIKDKCSAMECIGGGKICVSGSKREKAQFESA